MVIPARRKPLLALLAAAAGIAALPLYALAVDLPPKAPDLRADPVEPNSNYGTTAMVYGDTGGLATNRLLIRFDGFVTNVGRGPIELRGNPQITDPNNTNGVKQYAFASGQTSGLPSEPVGTPPIKFETADGHAHWHLLNAMRYSLRDAVTQAEVAPAQKVGFCLYDLEQAPPPRGPSPAANWVYTENVTGFCGAESLGGDGRDATSLRMGTSAGWRDVYGAHLSFQWVDVSDTAPGKYVVASQADPNNVIWEGGGTAPEETNVPAVTSFQFTVPGFVAQPLTVPRTGAPQEVTLTSVKFGNPGAVRYKIVSPPAHGTLSAPGNGDTVTYTPEAGYAGSDSFTYAARTNNVEFPGQGFEPTGTVSLNSVAPTLTISGAPGSMVAGTSVQLSAALANAGGGVSWSTSAGQITPGGLFTAPAVPATGGVAVVRATSTAVSGLASEATIAISAAPAPAPAPGNVGTKGVPVAGTKLLSRVVLVRNGGRVLVATLATGPKAGRVTVTMTIGKGKRLRVLGRCGARVSARRTVACKITVPRGITLRNVTATATITVGGTVRAVRRAAVARS